MKAAKHDPPVEPELLIVDHACFAFSHTCVDDELILLNNALDVPLCICADLISDPKTRHIGDLVHQLRSILGCCCGSLGPDHEAVASLAFFVDDDVWAAALRLAEGDGFCSGPLPPRAAICFDTYKTAGFIVAETLEQARDAILAGTSTIVKPTLDADHLIFLLS